MPYLSFKSQTGQNVELGGNKLEDFKQAIEKHGKIVAVDQALAWVTAFFDRRNSQVAKQKALQVNDAAKAEEASAHAKVSEAAENAAKSAYIQAAALALAGASGGSTAATVEKPQVSSSPYHTTAAATNGGSTQENKMVDNPEEDFL